MTNIEPSTMPPKAKTTSKAPSPESKAASDTPPETVAEQTRLRFYQTNPGEKRREEVGLHGLTPAEKKTYIYSNLLLPVAQRSVALSNKTEREFWKTAAKENLPIRHLRNDYDWGKDKTGRDIGSYKLEDFNKRRLKQTRLSALRALHRQFVTKTERAQAAGTEVPAEDIEQEKQRRRDMAALNKELYGETTGPLAQDPVWDDVIPIPQHETEGALAQIAYPDDYAEAVSYLRAVMASEECSTRCLRLTEHVINMNPAHYTVWLYRFKIISVLELPIQEELEWLNGVALEHLKNYQIWQHRQLLLDYLYPKIQSDEAAVKDLARSETQFITRILQDDTKNYHVWSYRQYLVEKLGLFNISELLSTQNLIEEDVRNNSAWSHRFFVVFSDPAQTTPGSPPTAHDPKVPDAILDRETNYAKEKILLAPQNQSPWNYLRGVITKGGRKLGSQGDFAEHFVSGLGEEDEDVKSSHALDYLADVCKEQGDVARARLILERLSEKWDPIREGYWRYRMAQLEK